MTKSFLLLPAFLLSLLAALPAQTSDCGQLLREAADFEKKEQYDRALKKYLSAKEECGTATATNVNELILKVFDKIQQQKQEADDAKAKAIKSEKQARQAAGEAKLAKEKAERSAKSNKLAALALSETETNPTLGLQLAGLAWLSSVDTASGLCAEPGVSAVLHNIASNPSMWFYQPLKGHRDAINDVAFSPDGMTLATASSDQTVRLWNLRGEPLDTLIGHTKAVRRVLYAADGQKLLTIADDYTARLWNQQGELVRVFEHSQKINSAVFSSDDRYILTASDSTARLWDIQTGENTRVWKGHRGPMVSAAFSPDGANVLTLSGGRLVLWDSTGAYKDSLFRGRYLVEALFDPSGRYIVANDYHSIYRSLVDTTTLVDTLKNTYANHIAFSGDGRWLFFWANEGLLNYAAFALFGEVDFMYDYSINMQGGVALAVSPGREEAVVAGAGVTLWNGPGQQNTLLRGHRGGATSAVFSPNGQFILTGGKGGRAHLWFKGSNSPLQNPSPMLGGSLRTEMAADGKKMAVWGRDRAAIFDFDSLSMRTLLLSEAKKIVFSPDGEQMVVTSYADSLFLILDRHGKILSRIILPKPVSPPSDSAEVVILKELESPFSEIIAFAPGNRRLALMTRASNQIILYDTRSAAAYPVRHPYRLDVYFAWSPDGSRLLTWGFGDTLAHIWDEQGRLLSTLSGHQADVSKGQFLPDGQHILTSSAGGTILWSASGHLLSKMLGRVLAQSPNGKRFLIGRENEMLLYEANGQLIRPLPKVDDAFKGRVAFFFTDDSRFLIGSVYTKTIAWDAEGHYLFEVEGIASRDYYNNARRTQHFFPNGSFITVVAKGAASTVRQWNAQGKLMRIYEGFDDVISDAVVAPNGRFVLAFNRQKIVVWDANGIAFRTLRLSGNQSVGQARFLPNSQYVLSMNEGYSGPPQLWAIGETFVKQCQSLEKADLLQAGAGVDVEEVLRSDNAADLTSMSEYYFDRSDWEHARMFYQRLEQVQHSPITLQRLYLIGEKSGRPLNTRAFYQVNSFEELILHADFFYMKKQWATARDLYEKAEPLQASARCLNQLHRLADTLHLPFDLARYNHLDGRFSELYGAADYLRQTGKNQAAAKQLHEKALSLQYDPYLIQHLYLMCLADGTPFDSTRFLATNNPSMLAENGYFFFAKGRWEMARQLYEKSESLLHRPRNLTQLFDISLKMKQPFDFNRFLSSNKLDELSQYASTMDTRSRRTLPKIADRVPIDIQITQLGEKMLSLDTTAETRRKVVNYYNSLGFEALFTGDGKAAEAAIRRGIAIDPDFPPLYTNLPPALLLQNRTDEAEKMYIEYQCQPYTTTGKKIYQDAFKGDIRDLEKAGVVCEGFGRIKKLLEKKCE